jgi:hypothetical protein
VFAQSLVLSGAPLPIKMDAPWHDELNDQLPYKKPDSQGDTEFSRDVHAIVDDIRAQYRRSGRQLEVITNTKHGKSV